MDMKIPFYGKEETISSIKDMGRGYFELEVYDNAGVTKSRTVISSREKMLKNYINAIDAYLFHMKDKYIEAKDILNNNTINKNCKFMALISLIAGIGIPLSGYLSGSTLMFYIGFAITAVMCIPTFCYSISELIFKNSIKDIETSIKEYESLERERNRAKEELKRMNMNNEKTVFRSIEPTKQEVKENTKKLIKEKE